MIISIIAGSVAVIVGLVVLTVIAVRVTGFGNKKEDTRTVHDHDQVGSIVLPTDWDVDNSARVGATDPSSNPADPEYLAQIDGDGGFPSEQEIEVWVEDPVTAADHRGWHRSEANQECDDLTCNHRGTATNVTIAGFPAIQQVIKDTRSGERSWELITTVRAPNRAVLIAAYTDHPTADIEAELRRQVATLKVLH